MGRSLQLTLLCFLLGPLPWAASQQVAPSNATRPQPSYHYDLQTSEVSMFTGFRVDPLTDNARLGAKQTKSGALFLATSQTANSLVEGDIAYISCDSSAYPGAIQAPQTIKDVVNKGPSAIVLFSNTSSSCTFTANSSTFTYNVIYTMIYANTSAMLQAALLNGRSQSTVSIQQSSSSGNVTTSGNPTFGGHSPTTAVAMIILYSITGIITALFLIIIVVGAIRAHRHPERYGPQTMLGRPRQSRARGIARAMLDTLPIVKFGEKEEPKPAPQGRDIEMGNTQPEAQPDHNPDPEHTRTSSEQKQEAANSKEDRTESHKENQTEHHPEHQGPEAVTTETAPATNQVPAGEVQADVNAENGLACSVCTDDFVHGQDIRVLPCNHKFHPECIDPWLLNVSGTCPLCRVDLRPTTSHPDHSDDPGAITSAEDYTANGHDIITNEQLAGAANRRSQHRSRTGLSLYIQHTLNRGRMRDATPEERLAALRRLRTVNRANDGESGGAINRLSARLSRVLDPERRHSSQRGSFAG